MKKRIDVDVLNKYLSPNEYGKYRYDPFKSQERAKELKLQREKPSPVTVNEKFYKVYKFAVNFVFRIVK